MRKRAALHGAVGRALEPSSVGEWVREGWHSQAITLPGPSPEICHGLSALPYVDLLAPKRSVRLQPTSPSPQALVALVPS